MLLSLVGGQWVAILERLWQYLEPSINGSLQMRTLCLSSVSQSPQSPLSFRYRIHNGTLAIRLIHECKKGGGSLTILLQTFTDIADRGPS
jgi:hypothetical protein